VWDLRQGSATWFSEKSVPTAVTAIVLMPGAEQVVSGSAPDYELYPEMLPVPTRGELWVAALRMVRDSPLLGIGPGQFRLWYGAFLGWEHWDGGIHANNLYLELAANTGLVGLATFLVLLLVAVAPQLKGLRAARVSSRSALIQVALLAAITAFLAHQLVDYFFGFTPTAILFWVLLGAGLGVALGVLGRVRSESPADARPTGPT
jgi:putative inorganic carbon (HCO3(-)) transporter